MFEARMSDWLDRLGERTPAPGGGAVAALCAASSAALLEMVARYTTGGRWADREEAMQAVIAEVAQLRARAQQLAEDDAEAFGAVGAAYGLPRSTPEEKAARSAAAAASATSSAVTGRRSAAPAPTAAAIASVNAGDSSAGSEATR